MTLTSLTEKSLKATRGARWWCLWPSRRVTDKHHSGSIHRRIALFTTKALGLDGYGVFFVKTVIINPQSLRLARVACAIRQQREKNTGSQTPLVQPNISLSRLVTDAEPDRIRVLYIYKVLCRINGIHLWKLWQAITWRGSLNVVESSQWTEEGGSPQ